jgi:hypothetical protein
MQHEQRRFAVQLIFAEAEARGTPVDGDPNFRKWVDEWINGHMEVAELRHRYNQLRDKKLSDKRAGRAEAARNKQIVEEPEDLLSEITRLTNTFEEAYPLLDENSGTPEKP